MQAIVIILIVLIAIIGSAAYYYATSPPPFSMQVAPKQIEDSIPGQRCVFLVGITEDGQGSNKGKAVKISAITSISRVTVEPQAITLGQIAEVTVIPDEASIGEVVTVIILGERDRLEKTEIVTVKVQEGEDRSAPTAEEIRDKFIQWLIANHPELGITKETQWTGTITRPHYPILMFYLFFSADWEIGVSWHWERGMSWARIYLRHRFTEMHPSHAFKIMAWTEKEVEPQATDPEEAFASEIWR